jgi:uncharacterized protein (UPF0332 family)
MTNEGRRATVVDELTLADEELRAADQLTQLGLHRVALTRVYFAAFHATRAMLYALGLEPKSHQGVLTLFNLHLVKAGHQSPSAARLLARLQKFREQADYGESFIVDAEGAREELLAARAFVAGAQAFVGGLAD